MNKEKVLQLADFVEKWDKFDMNMENTCLMGACVVLFEQADPVSYLYSRVVAHHLDIDADQARNLCWCPNDYNLHDFYHQRKEQVAEVLRVFAETGDAIDSWRTVWDKNR